MEVKLTVIRIDGKSITIKLDSEEIDKMKEIHNISLLDETYKQVINQL